MTALAPSAAVAHFRSEIAHADAMIADASRCMDESESDSAVYASARQQMTYAAGRRAAFREALIVLGEQP